MRVARGPVEVEAEGNENATGRIVVDETQRRRSRFRTRTDDGDEVGVVVDGAGVLSAGDVLETDEGERFVVELESIEALVVGFENGYDPAELVVTGHAVGNRHWDLVAYEGRVYVPTDGDAAGRRAFLEPYLPPNAQITVASVEPSLFDEREPRDGERHAHTHGDADHEHSHGHGHSHTDHDQTHTQSSTETTMTRDQLRRTAQEANDE